MSVVVLLAVPIGLSTFSPEPARAFNPLKPICKVAQFGSGAAGKLCGAITAPGKLLKAGGKLVTGHLGGAVQTVLGGGGGPSVAGTAVGLAAVVAWVLGGAKFALHETATVLGHTTSPQLQSTWFSSSYWRMAAIAALMTLPFLFAAAVQSMIRGDVALLIRAAFGYLPLALLAVGIAAPLTMLLLAASDQLSAIVTAAAGGGGTRFLAQAGAVVGVLSVFKGSPFLAFLVGLVAAGGALVLWLELLMREAAVYVVVLMLPLAFAAMVWPARRAWAVRAVEVLAALVLAKFAIVAVLALGGSALGHGGGGITGALAGTVLVLLGAFAPWALLRLLPLTEVASDAASSLRGRARIPVGVSSEDPGTLTGPAAAWAGALSAGMRRQAEEFGSDPHRLANELPAPAHAERLDERPPGRTANAEPISASAAPEPTPALAEASAASDGTTLTGTGQPISSIEAANADPGNGEHDGASTSDVETSPERSPGLAPMWQARDLSWRPFALWEEWPPAPLWPWPHRDGGLETASPGQGTGRSSAAHETPGAATDDRPAERRNPPTTGDDHDPLPARQEPDQGPL